MHAAAINGGHTFLTLQALEGILSSHQTMAKRASHRRAAIGPESSEFSCSHRRFARYIDENVLRCWSATTPRGARGVPDPGKLAEDGFVRAAQAEQHDVPRESSEGSENRQRSKSGESSESSKSSKSGKSS